MIPSPPRNEDAPSESERAGFLDDVDCFDAAFFGYTPREAALLDPQQRLFLQSCWRALEDAGLRPSGGARIGVFAGAGLPTYLVNNVAPALARGDETDKFLAYTANDKDFLATRAAYKLGLEGPAIAVQTACSTGLVAVHLACRSLQLGECDAALVGGVTIRTPEAAGVSSEAAGIESPEGRCRPFDASASGAVFSNGVGVIVLKDVEAALVDGDRIYALIKGTAVNNDGAGKASFTAPSAAGQASVIAEALAVADVDPASIAFVETHGTGTALGDAVELAGLQSVFGACPPASCGLGAVKANIGHTDVAAGMAGLIKAALSLSRGILPPLANWREPGPDSPLGVGPLYAPTEAVALHPRHGAVRAGVSAFGVGGTNAHVVLEAPPRAPAPAPDERPQLWVWSARGDAARRRLTEQLMALGRGEAAADVAWSLQTGREPLRDRAALAVRANAAPAFDRLRTGAVLTQKPRLAFLFPGQGAQFPGMGAALYREEPIFAETIDAAAAQLAPALGFDLRDALFPREGATESARARLRETAVAQPAIFAVSMAMRNLLADWGLKPDVVLGHSLGEYAALASAGVLSLEDALDLVAARGRLMQETPPGQMAAVFAGEDRVRPLLAPGAEIAAINSPTDCVVAGPPAAVAASLSALASAGVAVHPIATSHAFHTASIEAMLPAFAQRLAACARSAPRTPLISNLTGRPLEGDVPSPEYFTAQIRQPVRFGDGVATLLAGGPVLALEVGPGATLTGLARRQGLRVFPTSPNGGDRLALLDALGALWCEGVEPDWRKMHRAPRRRVDLPLYPFEPARHWIRPWAGEAAAQPPRAGLDVRAAGWRRLLQTETIAPQGRWAVIGADARVASALALSLRALGADDSAGPPDGAIVALTPGASLRQALARAVEGGRLRRCLFLLPGLVDILGTEPLSLDAARLAGTALALARERPEIDVRIVDPGDLDDTRSALPQFLTAPAPLSAWRGRAAFVPDFRAADWPSPSPPRPDAVYLVIGASGRIGRVAAAALRRAAPGATLYLASRSGRAPDGVGGETRAMDVADIEALTREIADKHGRIDGVVFAAGSLTVDAFAGATETAPETYFDAKAQGAAALAAALESVDCGFVLLCGSIAAWLGGVGYGAYAGANAAAASVARMANRRGKPNWITLSLDAVAGSALSGADAQEISEGELTAFFGRLILAAPGLGGVELVVSASDFTSRWTNFAATIGRGAAAEEAPTTADADDPIGAAWRAVLGTERAEESDNFFALGGSSLQALQLLAQLRRALNVEAPLAYLYEAPTLGALRARLSASPRSTATEPIRKTGPFPLTAGQLSLWLAEQCARTAGRYNVTELYRLDGPLDREVFLDALDALQNRHDALRTRFVEHDGAPAQIVDCARAPSLCEERVDPHALEARLVEEVRRRFDLAQEPAWRIVLLEAGARGRFLLLSAHHLVLDDWSIGVFFEELADAYDRRIAGAEAAPPLPPAPAFGAFAVLQAEAQASGAHDRLVAAWVKQLRDAPRRAPFPPAADEDGALRVQLDAAGTRELRRLGETLDASLFCVLLAIYNISLALETRCLDIVVGAPFAGRPPGNWDCVLGYFVNPAALRVDLRGATDFAAATARVKAAVVDAVTRELTPYERVVAALEAGPAGLFNVWFTMLTHSAPRAMAGGLRLTPTRLGPRPSRFDLAFVLEPDGEGFAGWLEYSGAAVGRAMAARIATRIEALIGEAITKGNFPISDPLSPETTPVAPLSLAGRARRRGGAVAAMESET